MSQRTRQLRGCGKERKRKNAVTHGDDARQRAPIQSRKKGRRRGLVWIWQRRAGVAQRVRSLKECRHGL